MTVWLWLLVAAAAVMAGTAAWFMLLIAASGRHPYVPRPVLDVIDAGPDPLDPDGVQAAVSRAVAVAARPVDWRPDI